MSPLQLYSDDYPPKLMGFEGVIPWPYLDTRGNVTVACGHLIPNLAYFTDIFGSPGRNCETIWEALKAEPAGMPAEHYKPVTGLELPDATIKHLLDDDLETVCEQLMSVQAWLPDRPQGPRNFVVDASFNLGTLRFLREYPKCMSYIYSQNWQKAASECGRIGVQQARNDWSVAQILSASSAQPD